MRLLLVDQFSDLGGAQQVLLELLPAMLERGWSAVVGMAGEGEMFGRVGELGIETARIECGPYTSGRKSPSDLARLLTGTPRLARQIKMLAERADLVYLNGPRLLPAAGLATLDVPIFFHAHSYLAPGASRSIAGMSLRSMHARVIGSCRFVADSWRQYVCGERISVIYNGVRGAGRRRDGRPVTCPTSAGAPTIACLGRIAIEKGQKEFLQAAADIHRAIPESRFVIYGSPLFSGEQYAAEVRDAAANLPVEFPGWIDDVYEALSHVSLLLVPSMAHEATTRVILEAFAMGVPVIAFRSGGIPEVITHGVDGFLADSADAMAELAIDLLGSPARCVAVGQAARATWERRFTLAHFHQQLLDYLDSSH